MASKSENMHILSLLIYIAKCASRWAQLFSYQSAYFLTSLPALGFIYFSILFSFVCTVDLMVMGLLRLSPGRAIPLSLLSSGLVSLRGQRPSFLLCSAATVCPRAATSRKELTINWFLGQLFPFGLLGIFLSRREKCRMSPLNKTWENIKR